MQEALSFGPWLKQRRRVLDLTQEELAQRAACSLSTLRKIEAGDLLPSKELARLLAVALAIPAEEQSAFIAFARDERRAALAPAFVAATATPQPFLPAPALSTPDAAPTTAPFPPTRPPQLPTQLTPLIGREAEVSTLQQMLTNPNCLLLTIVGPGGIGKTRLALAVAHTLTESRLPHSPFTSNQQPFGDGVYFASFVGVTAPAFMVSTLANALGFSFANVGDPKEQLLNYLRAKTMLLVLDNLEHLLDGIDLLIEILHAAPGVKLLTTSRERLTVAGEWVYELPVLSTPPQSKEAVAAVARYASVALFVERAQRVRHRFALSAENGAAVAQICRLVGGMPLGVELAASWVHTLSCAEIAREIEQSLDFLAVNHRNLQERQRSVRATFDHSWRLLQGEEQQVLRRLAVFRGGFQREAATAVAGATLPLLASLVSKSLVRRTTEERYDLHELVRQYAADHLRRDPQEERQTHYAHADHFLGTLADDSGLFNHQHAATRKVLMRESENLRVAWLWAAENGRYDLLHTAMRTFWLFHELRFLLHEGATLFAQALHHVRTQQPPEAMQRLQLIVWGALQAQQGWFLFRTGRFVEAHPLLVQAIALLRQQNDQAALADALYYLSVWEWFSSAFVLGQQHAQEALQLNRVWDRPWWAAMSLTVLGYCAHFQGVQTEALTHFEEALAIMRRLREPRTTAVFIGSLSNVLRALGRISETKALLQEALALATQLEDTWTLASTYEQMGITAAHAQEVAEAQQYLERAIALFGERGDTWLWTDALNHAGWLYTQVGNAVQAQQRFAEALRLAAAAQLAPNTLNALVGLATVQAKSTPTAVHLAIAHYAFSHSASTHEIKTHAEALRLQLAADREPHEIEAARLQAQHATLESLVAAIARVS